MSQAQPPARHSSRVASRIALPSQDEDVASLRRSIVAKLTYSVGRDPIVATERDRMGTQRRSGPSAENILSELGTVASRIG